MKEEKEVIWLIKLYNCQYIKGGLFKINKLACIKDFEKLLNAPENNSRFNHWIKEMIQLNVIEFSEKIKVGKGNLVDGYFINRDQIKKRLREIETYSKILYPYFSSIAELGLTKM
jgi:hypothetical protein